MSMSSAKTLTPSTCVLPLAANTLAPTKLTMPVVIAGDAEQVAEDDTLAAEQLQLQLNAGDAARIAVEEAAVAVRPPSSSSYASQFVDSYRSCGTGR